MTVFVVQEVPGRDILSALSYGALEILLPPGMQVTLSSQPVVRRLRQALKNFSDEDYLLLMGDPVAIGIACSVAASMNHGHYRILKWNRLNRTYIPLFVDTMDRSPQPPDIV